MKQIFILLFVVFFLTPGAFAEDVRFRSPVEKTNKQAAYEHAVFDQLQQAVKKKDVALLKNLLKSSNARIWTKKDTHGNNLFHLCGDVKTFSVLYMYLATVREEMLKEKNKVGEIPWMSYIMYGKEDIFLTYFPKSTLYADLQKVSFDLAHSGGLHYANALTQRDEITAQTSCAGGQTLWQRANLMCKGLKAGAKGYHQYNYPTGHALGMNNAAPIKNKMEQVRDLIAQTAPFLMN